MEFTTFSENFISYYADKVAPFGFNGLGFIVYKRTYARPLADGGTEEWYQTVRRCIEGAQEIGAKYTQEEAERLYDLMFNLKCTYAGRMLWQLGTDTVRRFGANSLLNCWFTRIAKPDDFSFLFENLMLGGGVGFSIRREDVHELPRIKKISRQISHEETKDADFIVPDSRQGWIELLRRLLDAYFKTGKGFTYSTILVRRKGAPIKGFGGTASGPEILIEGIQRIAAVLESRIGKKLRSIDALDICNILGHITVAGNVRRSAEIAIGDADDLLFTRAKRWDLGTIPNHRAMSNNTIYADSVDYISDEVWGGYAGNGEPYGFFNLPLAQSQGRLGEYRIDMAIGMNPCGEIDTWRDLWDSARLLYKTQKSVMAMPFIHEESRLVARRNMRIGVSVTGVCMIPRSVLHTWLDNLYTELRRYDKLWSAENNWPESVKLTTCKPSGTVSLLGGSTPGIHPAYSRYYIRRVRFNSDDPLIETLRNSGYSMEYAKEFDGSLNYNTLVVSFPCFAGDSAITRDSMSAIDQLELTKLMQTIWADNSVSVTVYYRPDELPLIKEWLTNNYETGIKAVSFLLHSEHGFVQAPYESIDEKAYTIELEKIKPIAVTAGGVLEDISCETAGYCPVR
jgi:ribonucleoside-triphosphate reductase (thioredoxin)